jgi:hypothetical protein
MQVIGKIEFQNPYIAGFFDGEGSIGIYKNGQGVFHLRTQLTQNVGAKSKELMQAMVDQFGGHFSKQKTLSGGEKYNWQLSSLPAMRFLKHIAPYLHLKESQALLAIIWQEQRPVPSRDARGRLKPYIVDKKVDEQVAKVMKELKHADIDVVMANQADLVKPVHTLKQFLCIKG